MNWEAEARRHQAVHDRSPDGVMIFQAVRDALQTIIDFEWLYSNPSASRIVGRPPDELVGRRLLVEMPGNKEAGLFDIYVRVVEEDVPHSHEFAYRHDGLDAWFRATSVKLDDGFYVAFADLTERKRAEEGAQRLAAIVRSSEHAIYSASTAGIIETWNEGAEKLFGYTSAEIVGQSAVCLVPEGRRREPVAALAELVASGGVRSLQTVRRAKSGALVNVSLTISAIGGPDGQAAGVAVIARDVTEEVRVREALVVAERMLSVGTLAAGVAHEINNPLTYTSANLDIVIEELHAIGGGASSGRMKEVERVAIEARGGAERIRKIVRGLMTFSGTDAEQRTLLDVRPLLDLSVALADGEVRGSARLVKDYGDTPPVTADESRLGQVFVHLIVNAAQAIGPGHVDENEIRITTSTDDTGRAVVEVRDTGPGIPRALLDRIFDPFFTTRPVGAGTGLGLSISYNLVHALGGEITVRNHEERGTTVRVVLPAGVPPLPRPTAVPAAPGATAARAAVLVVDDDVAVGKVLARVLRDHDVTVVTKAKDALALLDDGKRFDVILCDLMMPEMSGMELYEELVSRHPALVERLVFVSGGTFTDDARAFLARIANQRIEKPFDTARVRALVKRFRPA